MPALSTAASASPVSAKFGVVPFAPAGDTVLLVEDDPMLRQLFGVILKKCGLRVLSAQSGAECLRLFGAASNSISLVVMDCTLPDGNGGCLCYQLRETVPGLPVLLTSGRKQDALRTLLERDGPTAFLSKPFRLCDAMREVAALLGRPIAA
jgi:two-component system catabolic regulation response regulator CreB